MPTKACCAFTVSPPDSLFHKIPLGHPATHQGPSLFHHLHTHCMSAKVLETALLLCWEGPHQRPLLFHHLRTHGMSAKVLETALLLIREGLVQGPLLFHRLHTHCMSAKAMETAVLTNEQRPQRGLVDASACRQGDACRNSVERPPRASNCLGCPAALGQSCAAPERCLPCWDQGEELEVAPEIEAAGKRPALACSEADQTRHPAWVQRGQHAP